MELISLWVAAPVTFLEYCNLQSHIEFCQYNALHFLSRRRQSWSTLLVGSCCKIPRVLATSSGQKVTYSNQAFAYSCRNVLPVNGPTKSKMVFGWFVDFFESLSLFALKLRSRVQISIFEKSHYFFKFQVFSSRSLITKIWFASFWTFLKPF